jgi:hypothetical protein
VPDAVRIAAIRHRLRKPPAHPELALGFSQQQQASIGRLVRARDEITESKEKNPAAGRNAGKESGVYA